jgi:hypothetical protein
MDDTDAKRLKRAEACVSGIERLLEALVPAWRGRDSNDEKQREDLASAVKIGHSLLYVMKENGQASEAIHRKLTSMVMLAEGTLNPKPMIR